MKDLLRPHRLGLLLILSLAACLRIAGLSWGVPTAALPHVPFHPDEAWTMHVLKQFDPEHSDYNPEEGHREGTLSFFLWSGQALLLRAAGVINEIPVEAANYEEGYGKVLYWGRLLVAMFDVASVFMVYLTLATLGCSRRLALLGALLLAIAPFEVIHAHYLRAHIIANFFEVLTFYFSAKLLVTKRLRFAFLAGGAAGLATATRYPLAVIVIVPVFVLLINYGPSMLRKKEAAMSREELRKFLACFFAIGLAFAVAFGAGVPYLLLDFQSALPHLRMQASYTAESEFSLAKLLDISRLWIYVRQLIPYGNLFGLWAIFYAAIVYLLFQRRLYKVSIPLIAFMALYLYPTAKGYAVPVFIRAALPLFPVFALLTALAISDCAVRWNKNGIAYRALAISLCAVLLSTLAYDVAYVTAMMRRDPRVSMHRYLSRKAYSSTRRREVPLIVGVYEGGHNYFLLDPTLRLIQGADILTIPPGNAALDPRNAVDYVLVAGFFESHSLAHAMVKDLRARGFVLEREFKNEPSILGLSLHPPRPPHDLLYPFPTLFLMRNTATRRTSQDASTARP